LNCLSLPFGNNIGNTLLSDCVAVGIGGTDATEHHFTGKERDSESGNDYFGARYYASSMGRWMSPDPINLTNARLLNPANTLNKYAYGANNPLKFVDKDGKDITIFYEPDGSGHIFLAAVNPDKGTSAFLSFGPKDHGASKIEAVAGVPGEFNFPADVLGASSLTIQTNPGVTDQLITLINQMNSGAAPDFYALSRNCTTEVQDALKDLGMDFGDIDPATFWQDLYDRFSEDVKDNPFKGLPYLSAPHAPGKEYGNPINLGMNYRQLLQQLYINQELPREPKACVTAGGETTCDQ